MIANLNKIASSVQNPKAQARRFGHPRVLNRRDLYYRLAAFTGIVATSQRLGSRSYRPRNTGFSFARNDRHAFLKSSVSVKSLVAASSARVTGRGPRNFRSAAL